MSSASNGDEALPLLDRDRPDLIVLDALMPGMSAIDLAVDASQRGIPVIIMTGEAQASEELAVSGWRHLRKPFRIGVLLAEVSAVLAHAEQHVAMVRTSLPRLRETQDEHHEVFNPANESLLRSRAAREQRRRRLSAAHPSIAAVALGA